MPIRHSRTAEISRVELAVGEPCSSVVGGDSCEWSCARKLLAVAAFLPPGHRLDFTERREEHPGVTFILTWERERYVEPEELLAACEAAGRSLGIPLVAITGEDGVEEADLGEGDPHLSRVVLRSEEEGDDSLDIHVVGPVPIEASLSFSGFGLGLYESTVRTEWVPAYLFVLQVVVNLGMTLEHDDDDSDYLPESQSWWLACLEDQVGEGAIVEISGEAGLVGPLEIVARRDTEGPRVQVRGAGTDLSMRLAGSAAKLDDADILRLVESANDETFSSIVACERARCLARTAPAPAPRYGGCTVFRAWVDGVPGPERVVALSEAIGPIEASAEANPEDVVFDLVHYLPNGQPMLRRAELGMPVDRLVGESWLLPTWSWNPTTDEVARAFAGMTRNALEGWSRKLPDAPRATDTNGLTLSRWLDAVGRITGRGGLTASALIEADQAGSGLLPMALDPSTPVGLETTSAFWAAIEAAATGGHGHWPKWEGLLASGEWEDDSTDMFIDELVGMLGLPEAPRPSSPARGEAYVATLNSAAEALGREERLYAVPNDTGLALVVKLHPRVFEQLRDSGLIDALLPSGPGVAPAGVWERLRSLWPNQRS